MRSWVTILLLATALVSVAVECQRQQQQQQQKQGQQGQKTNTRLGLISSQLGVPPVPGGNPQGPVVRPNNQLSGCYCLPLNQPCSSLGGGVGNTGGGIIGGGSNQPPPSTSGVGVFDVRIVNRPRPSAHNSGNCPNPQDHVCCVPGTINTGGNQIQPQPGPTQPFRPNPVVPNPVQVGTGACGVSNPIRYRQTNFAEADFGEYPWMAIVLDLSNRYLGGGVLISSEWVLTAAHKIYKAQSMKVRLGEYDAQAPQDHPQHPHIEVRIDNIIIHPRFNSQSLADDVALLHLSQSINTQAYPHIGTACLPEQGQLFYGQSACWVTGWGKDAFENQGSFQNILKEVDVPMVDPFVCQERLRLSRLGPTFVLDKNSFVCAGGIEGKDACTGDGGAPLVCQSGRGWTVTGLVAWGIGCARSQLPGVYVNVANYVNFIRQYVRGV